jgi:hypothetical protein
VIAIAFTRRIAASNATMAAEVRARNSAFGRPAQL